MKRPSERQHSERAGIEPGPSSASPSSERAEAKPCEHAPIEMGSGRKWCTKCGEWVPTPPPTPQPRADTAKPCEHEWIGATSSESYCKRCGRDYRDGWRSPCTTEHAAQARVGAELPAMSPSLGPPSPTPQPRADTAGACEHECAGGYRVTPGGGEVFCCKCGEPMPALGIHRITRADTAGAKPNPWTKPFGQPGPTSTSPPNLVEALDKAVDYLDRPNDHPVWQLFEEPARAAHARETGEPDYTAQDGRTDALDALIDSWEGGDIDDGYFANRLRALFASAPGPKQGGAKR